MHSAWAHHMGMGMLRAEECGASASMQLQPAIYYQVLRSSVPSWHAPSWHEQQTLQISSASSGRADSALVSSTAAWVHWEHRFACCSCFRISPTKLRRAAMSRPDVSKACHRCAHFAAFSACTGAGHQCPAHQAARHWRQQDQDPRARCSVCPACPGPQRHQDWPHWWVWQQPHASVCRACAWVHACSAWEQYTAMQRRSSSNSSELNWAQPVSSWRGVQALIRTAGHDGHSFELHGDDSHRWRHVPEWRCECCRYLHLLIWAGTQDLEAAAHQRWWLWSPHVRTTRGHKTAGWTCDAEHGAVAGRSWWFRAAGHMACVRFMEQQPASAMQHRQGAAVAGWRSWCAASCRRAACQQAQHAAASSRQW